MPLAEAGGQGEEFAQPRPSPRPGDGTRPVGDGVGRPDGLLLAGGLRWYAVRHAVGESGGCGQKPGARELAHAGPRVSRALHCDLAVTGADARWQVPGALHDRGAGRTAAALSARALGLASISSCAADVIHALPGAPPHEHGVAPQTPRGATDGHVAIPYRPHDARAGGRQLWSRSLRAVPWSQARRAGEGCHQVMSGQGKPRRGHLRRGIVAHAPAAARQRRQRTADRLWLLSRPQRALDRYGAVPRKPESLAQESGGRNSNGGGRCALPEPVPQRGPSGGRRGRFWRHASRSQMRQRAAALRSDAGGLGWDINVPGRLRRGLRRRGRSRRVGHATPTRTRYRVHPKPRDAAGSHFHN
mmetsp:Transcript_32301/g.74666  ORF Transcript_32301/g.74666 Transcript_32301/m.74666 type:complete len:359 (-) Transcript_32301:1394-2470(-)